MTQDAFDLATEQLNLVKDFFTAQKKKFNQLKVNLIANSPDAPAHRPNVPAGRDAPAEAPATGLKGLKLEAIAVPLFDGTARGYAVFKKFWNDNMMGLTPSAQYAHLMKALPKHVKDQLSCVMKDAAEIWVQLEEKYGLPEVVASSVLDEILALDCKKLGTRFMPALCSLLEDSETLLENLEMTEWLTGSLSVRQMEDILPPDEKVGWAEKMDSYPGTTKYEKFTTFLEERKKVADKMRSIGKVQEEQKKDDPAGGGRVKEKCDYCKAPGHKFEDCEKKKKYCKDNKLCFKCLESHNFRKDCPNKPGGSGRGGGKGDKADRADRGKGFGVHSNSLRPADCLRCKYIGEQVRVCAGCDVKEKLDHCLAHCENWMIGSVSDRTAILKKASACPICLFPGHKADLCKNKDNPKYVCGVRGCTSHHHVSLHGCKDPVIVSVKAVFGSTTGSTMDSVNGEKPFESNVTKELDRVKD